MIRVWTRIIIYFIVFVLLQALVMNNIHLFNLITPFIYLYVVIKLPVDFSSSKIITISFLLGFIVDIFSNTFGMHAAACTLMGFVRNPLMDRFVDVKEIQAGSFPSYRLFGFGKFIRYTLLLVTIHHITLFLIDSFSFYQPLLMITRMLLSILFTLALMCIVEAFNLSKEKGGE